MYYAHLQGTDTESAIPYDHERCLGAMMAMRRNGRSGREEHEQSDRTAILITGQLFELDAALWQLHPATFVGADGLAVLGDAGDRREQTGADERGRLDRLDRCGDQVVEA